MKTNKLEHTPGPWSVEHAMGAKQQRTSIGANRCEISYKVVADIPNSRTCEVDAAFIVEACNNYETVKAQRDQSDKIAVSLMKQLNKAIAQRDELIEVLKDLLRAADASTCSSTVCDMARAALANLDTEAN